MRLLGKAGEQTLTESDPIQEYITEGVMKWREGFSIDEPLPLDSPLLGRYKKSIKESSMVARVPCHIEFLLCPKLYKLSGYRPADRYQFPDLLKEDNKFRP